MRIYSIEGNIGAGKTTLIEKLENNPTFLEELLQNSLFINKDAIGDNTATATDKTIDTSYTEYNRKPKVYLLREPVDIWSTVKDTDGLTILENFYKDPKKWSFPFQIMAFTTRLSEMRRIIKENPDCDILICERSLDADRHIFAKMLYDDGLIDQMSYEIYLKMYNEFSKEFALTGTLYLNVSPEICSQRIMKRGREGESNISLEYLEKCHRYHIEWFASATIDIINI